MALNWLNLVFRNKVVSGSTTKGTVLDIEDVDNNFKIIKDNVTILDGKRLKEIAEADGDVYQNEQFPKFDSATGKFIPANLPVGDGTGGGGGLIKFTLAQNVYLEHNFFQFDFYGTADADLVLKNTNGAAGETAIGTEAFDIGVENWGTANVTIKAETGLTLVKEDLTAFTGSAILEPGKICFLRSTTTSGELRVIGEISDIEITPYTEEYMLSFTASGYESPSPITNVITRSTGSTLALIDSGTHDASQGRIMRQVVVSNIQHSNSVGYVGAIAEFPASTTERAWYVSAANGDPMKFDFEGFDPAKTYKIRIFPSTTSSGERQGNYTILDAVNPAGVMQTIHAHNNTTVLEWLGVTPDANGKWSFYIAQATATDLAYVNVIGITPEP